MLRVLLAKDLRRAWRNPLPWVINLIVPLAMTALLGMVFGGHSENDALGHIRFAVVDEDHSLLGRVLRGAANQEQVTEHLEPVFMDREPAMKLVNAGKISAVLILQTNFLRNYLTARQPVCLELIKNPAESIRPAVIEELLGATVAALNVVSRNFNSDFPEWQKAITNREDYHQVLSLIEREGDKIKAARHFLNPPLVSYQKEEPAGTNSATSQGGKLQTSPAEPGNGIFGYLLLGMSAMFLLFLGQNGMTDLHRELQKRTFERYRTMHQQVWPFLLGKLVFVVVMLIICSAILIGGGGLVFRIHWQHSLALVALGAGYSCFVAAFFAVLVALVPDERRAGVLNNLAGMVLGLAGGCAFPPQQLPTLLREHITTRLPSYWFANAARNLQSGGDVLWGIVLLKLLLCAVVLIAVAGWLFQRRFKSGLRA
jgi:ABC-type multidrug transport system permease subunit